MPGKKFCPKCGKTYEGDGLCAACHLEQHRLFELPAFIEVRICSRCGSIFNAGRWKKGAVFEAIDDAIERELKINSDVKDPDVRIQTEMIDSYSWRAAVEIGGTLKGDRVSEKANVSIRLKRDSCERCSKIAGGYYNAIIQIRGDSRVPSDDELRSGLKIAHEIVERMKRSGDEMAFITDEKKVSEGVDLYVSTISAGKQISKAITGEMGGSVSTSPKLMGKKDGKEIYRVNYSVRLPRYVNGDILAIDGDVIELKRMDKLLVGVDLNTGGKYSSRSDEVRNIAKMGSRSDAKKALLTEVGDIEVQILDPEDFTPVYLSRPGFLKAVSGSEILVIKTSSGIFVLPD